VVYVDDLLMIGKPKDNTKGVQDLNCHFKLKNYGIITSFLGLYVRYKDGMFHLNQTGYIHRKADKYGLTDSIPYETLLDHSLPLVSATPDDKLCDQKSTTGYVFIFKAGPIS
jgi:hypothetical protein